MSKEIYLKYLIQLKKDCEVIESRWNGEDKGTREDNAHIAHEISEKVDEILGLLNELK